MVNGYVSADEEANFCLTYKVYCNTVKKSEAQTVFF